MRRVKDLALRYKIFLGYAVIIVLFIFLGIYFVSFTFKISKASRNIETNFFSGVEIASNLEITFHDLTFLENSLSSTLYGNDKLNSINNQVRELVEKFLIHITELRDVHPDKEDVIGGLENKFKLYSTQVFSKIEAQKRGEIEVFVYENSAAGDVADIINTLRDEDIAGLSIALGSIDKFAAILRSSYLAILVFCIFISILISLFIARLIVKPINGLLLAQRKVGEGKLNYEFKVESTDEIGQLQKGFLDMAKRLALLYKQIEDERNNLEEKVEERTLALQLSYEKIEEHNRSLEDIVRERTASLTKTIAEADKQRLAILNILEDVEDARRELTVLNNELKHAQAQLVQSAKMAAVGQLASGVAHEINNPLTGVLNNLQLIKMETEQRTDFSISDFKELLNIIEESALRCKKITRSLLDFSHASKGIYQASSLNEIIDKVVMLVEHEMNLENIVIVKDLPSAVLFIDCDVQLLQQVIFNLISNAKWAIEKKSKREGGTIDIKVCFNAEEKAVCLNVSDSGIGIPKEIQEKIFEPFFTTKTVGEGTGLGLSVVYSIVRDHKGKITVESEVGKGTTFKVCFPALPQEGDSGAVM